MSTISLPYEKQIRHFYLGTAIAGETSISTFYDSASIGEIQIFAVSDGLTATTTGDFFIAKKNQKGGLSVSDSISGADISYLRGSSPQAKAGAAQKFTLSSNPVAGKEYILTMKINYGNSEENFITFTVGAKAPSTDAGALFDALGAQLAAVLAKSINTTAKPGTADETLAGAAATGTVQLSAGASGSVDSITVGGVEVLGAVVPFNTSLNQTAADVAAQINAYNSSTNYYATVATDTVTIVSVATGVVTGTVTSTTTTLTSVDVDLGTASAGTSTATMSPNKYFQIDSASNDDSLTITEKDWILDDFRVGLRTHDQLMWNVEIFSPDDTENDKITKVSGDDTALWRAVFPKGQGYQVIELERFLVGHRAETTEFLDSTLGFGRDYDTAIASSYYTLDLKYHDISRDDPKHSEKMLTIVSTDAAVVNSIGNAIESRSSYTWTDLT